MFHARHEHVRIVWFGDSHGQADFWSGALRDALARQLGSGGPGFLHLGYKGYRHDGARFALMGDWRVTPKGPSTTIPTSDGRFGLGGLTTHAPVGARVEVTLTDPDRTRRELSWDLCYRADRPEDAFEATLSDELPKSIQGTDAATPSLRHVVMRGKGRSLTLMPTRGRPQFCGVVVETDPQTAPGVVVDTLGINGARLATPLAWDERTFALELAKRAPNLAIIEYGTNESGDNHADPKIYTEHLSRFVARLRTASPSLDCLVLAPTDRAGTEERTPRIRDALQDGAHANGCAFWDTFAAMGGAGSIRAWHASTPSRAASDGVHLNALGYRELGARLSQFLLQGPP